MTGLRLGAGSHCDHHLGTYVRIAPKLRHRVAHGSPISDLKAKTFSPRLMRWRKLSVPHRCIAFRFIGRHFHPPQVAGEWS